MQQALDAARAANVITGQLLTFASGGEAVHRSTDLKRMLLQALDFALSGSNSRGDPELAADLWPAEVDEEQITQVIRNLVLNARQAMPAGGTVVLRAENVVLKATEGLDLPLGNYLRITVTDAGDGVPADILPTIFDPYFSTKQRGTQKGMGLGLTICHLVIRKHGGAIVVNSRRSRGPSICCFLPASKPSQSPAAVVSEFAPARSAKILVMDDEENIRRVLAEALAQLGYAVELAREGKEAVVLYENATKQGAPFDAILLDLTVKGGMGGAETLKILREQTPDVRAVLVTGYNQDQTFRDYAQRGFSAALSKPFQIEEMRAVLAGVLASDRARS